MCGKLPGDTSDMFYFILLVNQTFYVFGKSDIFENFLGQLTFLGHEILKN